MNRANFFKSLLTIIVAPKVIIKALANKPDYNFTQGERIRFCQYQNDPTISVNDLRKTLFKFTVRHQYKN